MAKKKATAKRSVQKRTLNQPVEQPSKQPVQGVGFNEQDAKRRLGNFQSAGEPARKGSRSAGIVGQKKQKHHTDKSK